MFQINIQEIGVWHFLSLVGKSIHFWQVIACA